MTGLHEVQFLEYASVVYKSDRTIMKRAIKVLGRRRR